MDNEKNTLELIPISQVFSIIDSCINENQLETCKQLSKFYTQLAKEKGVINPRDIKTNIDIKIEEKRTELEYIEEFI
jgi:hypothetical protein